VSGAGGALGLFAAHGIELEYMIVNAATQDVAPVADALLAEAGGGICDSHDNGAIAWSNELARHVIELKTNGPAPDLAAAAAGFAANVADINQRLAARGARLMPGGMHPWMDPVRELQLWPHGQDEIYRAYDRIFGCGGHGWANLQSMHLNLPFADDDQFARLHAAVRLLLPLLPALAAASPFADGRDSGFCDFRLEVYRGNQARIPGISGDVVPEPATSISDYHARILQPMYAAIAPHDPEGLLQEEWLNSRGAIARFDRGAIEIRVLDTQECPAADLARAALISAVLQTLCAGQAAPLAAQQQYPQAELVAQYQACVRDGDEAPLLDRELARLLGLRALQRSAGMLWQALAEQWLRPHALNHPAWRAPLRVQFEHGCLARRLRAAVGVPSPQRLRDMAGRLCGCLAHNQAFIP
jgi:gamma-glutamyl:cysteine ligase YbdK (ATP-grasp superfamily)